MLLLWLSLGLVLHASSLSVAIANIAGLILLYGEFISLTYFWGRAVYRRRYLLRHYGLKVSRRSWFNFTVGLGLLTFLALLGLEGQLGWLVWQSSKTPIVPTMLAGAVVALGVSFPE